MKILIDTNVAIDLLAERQPFVAEAIQVFALVDSGRIEAYLSAHAVTTLDYVLRKDVGRQGSRVALHHLLTQIKVKVAPVNPTVIDEALVSNFSDFEDGVTHAAARAVNAQIIVTRDVKDFTASDISVLEPSLFLARIDDDSSQS